MGTKPGSLDRPAKRRKSSPGEEKGGRARSTIVEEIQRIVERLKGEPRGGAKEADEKRGTALVLDYKSRQKARSFCYEHAQIISINDSPYWYFLSRTETLEKLDKMYNCEVVSIGRYVYFKSEDNPGLRLEVSAPSPAGVLRCARKIEQVSKHGPNALR